jgi:hypothetical protein
MRYVSIPFLALGLIAGGDGAAARQTPYRTHNDRFGPPHYATVDAWKQRAQFLREHVLASAGLLPLPERTPLRSSIFGEITHQDYSVSKVYFESLPGFFVTGNLYRPIGEGPFPAILSTHGHWPYGRLENTELTSAPGRAINLARQGFVVFTYDMIGYNDSRQVPHTFAGRREYLWGLSLAGLQLWNSMRAVDFLESLPYVRRDAIGATGESGGGTQTFLLAAVDSRIAVAAPVNMISLHMQGGCICENPPGLRLDTTNVEIAATIAPRPLLMVSATGDWTKETLELEYPAVRAIYDLLGVTDRVHAVRFAAEHNYNRDSREAMYAWMARWLQNAPADIRRPERAFTPEKLPDLLVLFHRPLPLAAVNSGELTDNWIEAAKRQLTSASPADLVAALRHALGFAPEPIPRASNAPSLNGSVLLATADRELETTLKSAGLHVRTIPLTAFDAEGAAKIRHFETYNRTAASQRVADIVAAIRGNPGAALVAGGDAALAGLLALSAVSVPLAILDVGRFDTSSDEDFLTHLYIPGLRRAGDLQTAASLQRGKLVVHNAGERFSVRGVDSQARKLSVSEIAGIIQKARSSATR